MTSDPVLAPLEAVDPILSRRKAVQDAVSANLGRRKAVAKVAAGLCFSAIVAALIPLVAILVYTIRRGISAWSVAFFAHLPTPAGIPGGGIYNAIIGTLIIVAVAVVIAVPLSVVGGLYLAQSSGRVAGLMRYGADVLSGVPSIVIGIFAYVVVVVPLGHFSAISGSLALAVIMLPIALRTSELAYRGVPRDVVEAGEALGGRQATIARRIIVPTAIPGVLTGVLLGVSRVAGETAPLLFTAIGSQYFSTSLTGPMAAMPLVVYLDGIQAYKSLQQTAWGTALALIVLIAILSVVSRLVAAHRRRKTR